MNKLFNIYKKLDKLIKINIQNKIIKNLIYITKKIINKCYKKNYLFYTYYLFQEVENQLYDNN
jgi:hypothetical protein